MWFKKRESQSYKELLKLMEIINLKVADHSAQISNINKRLIQKLSSLNGEGGSSHHLPPDDTEKPIYNDGFDDLRKLNKDGDNS